MADPARREDVVGHHIWRGLCPYTSIHVYLVDSRNSSNRGPAVPEPESPSATKTATARSPRMAIIHARVSGGLFVPYSAVPVLAMIFLPGMDDKNWALPDVTALRIIERSAFASSFLSGSGSSASLSRRALWSGSSVGTTDLPCATDAATVAIASGEAAILPCPIIDAACSTVEDFAGTEP